MGKLARLNAEKKQTPKEVFIAAIKVDNSYEIKKEVDGKEVVEKISNLFYVPLSTGVGYVSSYDSPAEADLYFSMIVNNTKDERQQATLFATETRLLSVRYVPDKKRMLNKEWIEKNLIREIPVNLKKYKSAKQL